MIDLFSSLPPHMNRFDDAGKNIGTQHFRRCLESWLEHEFRAHSINSDSEDPPEFESEYPINRLTLKRDAKDLCGKPLIYLSDFLRLASERSHGLLAITNADIIFKLAPENLQYIKNLQPGQFICERRYDYHYGKQDSAKPYRPGFDFIVMHRDDVHILLDTGLVFGMPWWDYLVPTKLLASGLKRQPLPSQASIYHLMHDERWNSSNFIEFGEIFRTELDKIASHTVKTPGYQILFDRLLWVEDNGPILPYPRRSQFVRNLMGRMPDDPILNRMFWMGTLCVRYYENPGEHRLSLLNFDRFINRLPF